MAHYQVVCRMNCERTAGHPELLRRMATYLGFQWHPEYMVHEIPRHYGQAFFRATVCIKEDDGPRIVHKCEAFASTVDMAVHWAAYLCVTVLHL